MTKSLISTFLVLQTTMAQLVHFTVLYQSKNNTDGSTTQVNTEALTLSMNGDLNLQ